MKGLARFGFDLVYVIFFLIVTGPAAYETAWCLRLLYGRIGFTWTALVSPAFYFVFLFGLVIQACLITLLLPRLKPGRYRFPGDPQMVVWAFHFTLQRVMNLPLWKTSLMTLASLRTLLIRGYGGHIAFDIDASSDLDIGDPGLVEIEPDVLIGGSVIIVCHMMEHGHVILAPVKIGRGAQLMGASALLAGVTVGEYAIIGPESKLAPNVSIGPYAHLGYGCRLSTGVTVGAHAILGHDVAADAGVVIGEGAVIQSGARLTKGTRVADGARFPPHAGRTPSTEVP